MLAAICSMEEDTSSTDADCSVAPWDNCSEPELISWLPDMTWLATDWIFDATSSDLPTIFAMACISLSWADRSLTLTVRFPAAISSAVVVTSFIASISI